MTTATINGRDFARAVHKAFESQPTIEITTDPGGNSVTVGWQYDQAAILERAVRNLAGAGILADERMRESLSKLIAAIIRNDGDNIQSAIQTVARNIRFSRKAAA
jgi:hypothetical protein